MSVFISFKVCSESDMTNVLKITKEKYGRLDNLVNCAAIASSFQTCNFNKKTVHRLSDFERIIMVSIANVTASYKNK